jgi:hypothetical protein
MKILFEPGKIFAYVISITVGAVLVASLMVGTGDQVKIEYVAAQDQGGESGAQFSVANITGDLTKPSGDNPYGGDRTGEVTITSDGHQTDIEGLINASPAAGNVYEGWLVDAGGSEYKLSLGQLLENGTIDFSQHMVNPFTYKVFYITQEPQDDVDPNAASPIAGIELETPFGQ